jgi:hypothetical protein
MTGPVTFDVTTRRGRERIREVFTGCKASSLSEDDLERASAAGYEPGSDGYMAGRDPRQMTPDELRAMGHEPSSPMDAIRAKYLDCAGSAHEVLLCVVMACPLHPFRAGKNRWRSPISEERREALRERGARLADLRKNKASGEGTDPDKESYLPEDEPLERRILSSPKNPARRS